MSVWRACDLSILSIADALKALPRAEPEELYRVPDLPA